MSTVVQAARGRKRKLEENGSPSDISLVKTGTQEQSEPNQSKKNILPLLPGTWYTISKKKNKNTKDKNVNIVSEIRKNPLDRLDAFGFQIRRTPLRSIQNLNANLTEENIDTKVVWEGKDFYDLKVIGTGGFSTVFKAYCRCVEGTEFALKQVNYESLRKLARNANECAFYEEYKVHRTLIHDNIVKALGFYRSMIIRNAVIVLEYCKKGDLQDYLNNAGFPVSQERSHNYVKEIARGLEYLHLNAKMIHMDLKLENILISETDVAKLTDFGFSIKMHAVRKLHWKSRGGTRWYKPPEQLKHGYFDSTADIWAFGCIAFELMMDYHPFFLTDKASEESNSLEEEPTAIARMVEASNGHFRRSHVFEKQSEKFKNFVTQVLSFSRLQRPTAKQLLSLEWISS